MMFFKIIKIKNRQDYNRLGNQVNINELIRKVNTKFVILRNEESHQVARQRFGLRCVTGIKIPMS